MHLVLVTCTWWSATANSKIWGAHKTERYAMCLCAHVCSCMHVCIYVAKQVWFCQIMQLKFVKIQLRSVTMSRCMHTGSLSQNIICIFLYPCMHWIQWGAVITAVGACSGSVDGSAPACSKKMVWIRQSNSHEPTKIAFTALSPATCRVTIYRRRRPTDCE